MEKMFLSFLLEINAILEKERQVTTEEGFEFAEKHGFQFFETSAKLLKMLLKCLKA